MDEDDADALPLPLLMGKRGATGPDPRTKGRRPAAEPDLPPTGKRPAALLDPRPMEEEARVPLTLAFRPAATLNAAAPESDGVLGWSISLVKIPGKNEEYTETAVDLACKIHSRVPSSARAPVLDPPLVDSPVQRDSRETTASWTTSHAHRLAKRRGELVCSGRGFFL
ncbi:hypothetical protein SETIT_4G189700v2 [Setaria italica]|uniref:Uncharacterized protein n=1 Tax=Setaria italica TaxID=4555 RepID=A0A368QVU7_SETIT|nr:hypothetical protein SETIT_4G189700v2 [Setaria italica]